eukprot:3306703-Alexandrium_andersonii.AAC.1
MVPAALAPLPSARCTVAGSVGACAGAGRAGAERALVPQQSATDLVGVTGVAAIGEQAVAKD